MNAPSHYRDIGRWRHSLSERMLGEWKGKDILNIGTGHSAWVERHFAGGKCRLVTGDFDRKLVRFPQRLGVPGVVFRAEHLPFGDQSFDLVTLFEVLEHIYADDACLREIRRVLRPEGRLVFSVPNDSLLQYMNPIKYLQHERHYTGVDLQRLFSQANFRIVSLFTGGSFWTLGWLLIHLFWHGLFRRLVYPRFLAPLIDREYRTSRSWKMDIIGVATPDHFQV